MIMQLYDKNKGEIVETPYNIGGRDIDIGRPDLDVYEYRKPVIDPETQTLDGIIIVDGIATNVIIPYKKWEFPDCHCRIWAKQEDCEGRTGGQLAVLTTDLTNQMSIEGENTSQLIISEGVVYYVFYAKFLKKSDKFYLESGVIKNNSPQIGDKIFIEQYTSFSENDTLLFQDDL